MKVICTGGHVDHGKSTLVQALTGIHPDRWAEEIRREMTIDLGFAWFTAPCGEHIAMIDVPGHRDFIENMLAGMVGIDAFLLVVAADEGIMPQTREHLAIFRLMGLEQGLVALTKADLAESDDWLELVQMDVADWLAEQGYPHIPIIPVSVRDSLNPLIETLEAVLAQTRQLPNLDQPFLPIDRVFSLKGFGTVVTGTLLDGHLEVGDSVEIHPIGLQTRIRGLQSHHQSLDRAAQGSRVAVNLQNADRDLLYRGCVLTHAKQIQPTQLIDVVYQHLPQAAHPLKHNSVVKFFAGPSETLASVYLLEGNHLAEEGYLQLKLHSPLALRPHSRFVLRLPSPSQTIGGGLILDLHPPRRWRRNRPDVLERFAALASPDPAAHLAYTLKLAATPQPCTDFDPLLLERASQQFGVKIIQDFAIHPDSLARLETRATALLRDFHQQNPLALGMDSKQFWQKLGLTPTQGALLGDLWGQTTVLSEGNWVWLKGMNQQLTKAQRHHLQEVLQDFAQHPFDPPSYKETSERLGNSLLKSLLAQHTLLFLPPDTLLLPEAYQALLRFAQEILETETYLTIGKIRDHFQASRRVAVALLDLLAKKDLTTREEEGHRLKYSNWSAFGL